MEGRFIIELKADGPHLRNYPHTPTDYRYTDIPLRLLPFVAFGKAEPLISTAAHQKFESAHRRTNGRTDRWTLPSTLSPRFAVDKN